MEKGKPNCYKCPARWQLSYTHHSECRAGGTPTETFLHATALKTIRVKLNPHGVKNGWAAWPYNFDPIWVDECSAFTHWQDNNMLTTELAIAA